MLAFILVTLMAVHSMPAPGAGMPGPARPVFLTQSPPAPTRLTQLDRFGDLPLADLLGEPEIGFRFQVLSSPGDLLRAEVELRPTGEAFNQANLVGDPVPAGGTAQWLEVWNRDRLRQSGYHWRARVVGSGGASAWVNFGDNSDTVQPPARFADADFYNLHEPMVAYPDPPAGFEGLARIGQLPLLVPSVQTFQVSSFDRSEGNADGGSEEPGLETYFYREGAAEVVLEAKGPGQINRIWFAESNDPSFVNTRLQVFFGGATEPTIDLPVVDLMSGEVPPFVEPFVLNADRSSGGLISYVPMPFRDGVKVRFAGPHAHYQITYQLFAERGNIETFTGNEDYTLAQHLWRRTGLDPKPTRGNETEQIDANLASGATVMLVDLQGPGALQSLRLQLPQLQTTIYSDPPLEDTVRAHLAGESRFHLRPLFSDTPTRLRMRRGCRFAPQTATVFAGGAELGQWMRQEGNDRNRWCDDSFYLPSDVVLAGMPIDLRLVSESTGHPWEEARYWLEQLDLGHWRTADELDVGDVLSEQEHGYSIAGQTGFGLQVNTYPAIVVSRPDSQALLAGLRLRITADDHETADVDIPVGAFFGSAVGETNIESLMAGIQPERHILYSYWPMPYAHRLKIELVNTSHIPVHAMHAEIAYDHTVYPSPGRHTGYFRSAEYLSRPTETSTDHGLIHARSAGKLVGLHLLVHSGNEAFIEGDERWHVDGARTPQVRGTGTEDVFNGGWYYNRGRIIRPVHGANSTRLEGWIDQYRWFLNDFISFADRLDGGIEHGPTNDINGDYSSWTFAYAAEGSALLGTDSVDLDDPDSMMDHQVELSGPVQPFQMVGQFEGDDDSLVSDGGLQLQAGSVLSVTLAVDPAARQILLRRRYDQGENKEQLRVWVDGQQAGFWVDGGRNTSRRWRESIFLVPPELTAGKGRVMVRFEPVSWAGSQGATMARLTALSQYRAEHDMWLPMVIVNSH
ncbi:MAG: DUF2961 domain-containing protein [Chloroflexota bacterium]|nr:DUF2961 domain-containing protein [Chloroflexota bacterium]